VHTVDYIVSLRSINLSGRTRRRQGCQYRDAGFPKILAPNCLGSAVWREDLPNHHQHSENPRCQTLFHDLTPLLFNFPP
jgi:hypothetical protein